MLTVVIPAHNSDNNRLTRTLEGLKVQSLPQQNWELLLIDNASADPLENQFNLNWHPRGRIVREESLGLTPARIKGMQEAAGDAIIMVDDDNVLDSYYLQHCSDILSSYPRLGAFGGKNLPEFETSPEWWFENIHAPLAIDNHGSEPMIAHANTFTSHQMYPAFAPVGAGMCLRRAAASAWMNAVTRDPLRRSLDRTGNSLASGGDNDIVLTILENGWDVGYFPQLCLTHLIPSSRLTVGYHSCLIEQSNRSWVLTLGVHGISPWPPIRPQTVWLRKLRAALRMQPWKDIPSRLRWKGACGKLEGQADLWRLRLQGMEWK